VRLLASPEVRLSARLRLGVVAALLSLAGNGSPAGAAGASEPLLAIELAGGGAAHHPLSRIAAVGFHGDTLVVSEIGGSDFPYPLETLARIRFDSSGAATSAPDGAVPDTGVDWIVMAAHLFPNRPNPALASTSIRFELPAPGPAGLTIHDVTGALVRTLAQGRRAAGAHTVVWDGRDDAGERVAAGVYFYRLRADGVDESRRMIYLR
jgi:hypothetical protein